MAHQNRHWIDRFPRRWILELSFLTILLIEFKPYVGFHADVIKVLDLGFFLNVCRFWPMALRWSCKGMHSVWLKPLLVMRKTTKMNVKIRCGMAPTWVSPQGPPPILMLIMTSLMPQARPTRQQAYLASIYFLSALSRFLVKLMITAECEVEKISGMALSVLH